jgi:hypothetical protein
MKPMDLISTPIFITYTEIKVDKIDLFEDACGLTSEFSDVINLLHLVKAVPGRCMTRNLKIKIRKEA